MAQPPPSISSHSSSEAFPQQESCTIAPILCALAIIASLGICVVSCLAYYNVPGFSGWSTINSLSGMGIGTVSSLVFIFLGLHYVCDKESTPPPHVMPQITYPTYQQSQMNPAVTLPTPPEQCPHLQALKEKRASLTFELPAATELSVIEPLHSALGGKLAPGAIFPTVRERDIFIAKLRNIYVGLITGEPFVIGVGNRVTTFQITAQEKAVPLSRIPLARAFIQEQLSAYLYSQEAFDLFFAPYAFEEETAHLQPLVTQHRDAFCKTLRHDLRTLYRVREKDPLLNSQNHVDAIFAYIDEQITAFNHVMIRTCPKGIWIPVKREEIEPRTADSIKIDESMNACRVIRDGTPILVPYPPLETLKQQRKKDVTCTPPIATALPLIDKIILDLRIPNDSSPKAAKEHFITKLKEIYVGLLNDSVSIIVNFRAKTFEGDHAFQNRIHLARQFVTKQLTSLKMAQTDIDAFFISCSKEEENHVQLLIAAHQKEYFETLKNAIQALLYSKSPEQIVASDRIFNHLIPTEENDVSAIFAYFEEEMNAYNTAMGNYLMTYPTIALKPLVLPEDWEWGFHMSEKFIKSEIGLKKSLAKLNP